MWARAATRTDRESAQQHAVAASYSGGKWRGEIMGILGNYQMSPDKYRERGYSLYGEYALEPHYAIGVSSLIAHAEDDRLNPGSGPYTRQAHGLTGRLAPIEPLAILAEADLLLRSDQSAGYVGMVQADYEFIQGLHGLVTGEIQDQGKVSGAPSVTGFGKPMLGAWLSVGWFFFTHFDARIDVVFRDLAPATIQSQVHWYF